MPKKKLFPIKKSQKDSKTIMVATAMPEMVKSLQSFNLKNEIVTSISLLSKLQLLPV